MTTNHYALVVLACVTAAGCGGGGGITAPTTAPVSGTVLVKGKPAAGVTVKFHPKFDIGAVRFVPSGVTNKDGRFILSTAAANDGAPPGEYAVTFELMRATSDKAGLDVEVDAWKGKHADPAAGKWPATVRSGENNLDPFMLD